MIVKSTRTTQPNQLLFDWTGSSLAQPEPAEIRSEPEPLLSLPSVAVAPEPVAQQSNPLPEPLTFRNPDLVQVLPWDFRTSFPRPTEDAILNGTLQPEDAEPENL